MAPPEPTAEEKQNQDIRIIALLVLPASLIGLSIWLIFWPPEFIKCVAEEHFKTLVGVPFAYLLSLLLVLLLRQDEKHIEVKGFSLMFSGFAGEVILWVICFLAISWSISFLWK